MQAFGTPAISRRADAGRYFIVSFGVGLQVITGVTIWWNSRKPKKRAPRRASDESSLTATPASFHQRRAPSCPDRGTWSARRQSRAPRRPTRSTTRPERREICQTGCISCHGPDGTGVAERHRSASASVLPISRTASRPRVSVGPTGGPPSRTADGSAGSTAQMPAFKDAMTSTDIDKVVGVSAQLAATARGRTATSTCRARSSPRRRSPRTNLVVTTTRTIERQSTSNTFVYEHRLGARSQMKWRCRFDLQKTNGGSWSRASATSRSRSKHVLCQPGHRLDYQRWGRNLLATGKESEGLGGGVTVRTVRGVQPAAFGERVPASARRLRAIAESPWRTTSRFCARRSVAVSGSRRRAHVVSDGRAGQRARTNQRRARNGTSAADANHLEPAQARHRQPGPADSRQRTGWPPAKR